MIDLARIYNLSKTNDNFLLAELIESTLSMNRELAIRELFPYNQEEGEWGRKIFYMPRENNKRIDFNKLGRIIVENLGPIVLTEKSKNPCNSFNYFLPKTIKQKNGIIDPFIRGNYEDIELPVVPERDENTETGIRLFKDDEQILATYYLSKTDDENLLKELYLATKIHGRNYGGIIMRIPVFRMMSHQFPWHVKEIKMPTYADGGINYRDLRYIIENHPEPLIIYYTNKKTEELFDFFLPKISKQEEGKKDPYIREEYFQIQKAIRDIDEPEWWDERTLELSNLKKINTSP